MIGAFIAGAAIGLIAGWAISSWRNARDEAPPPSFSCLGLTNGRPGKLDPYHERLMRPVLEALGREL
jgi:hypothetical protein